MKTLFSVILILAIGIAKLTAQTDSVPAGFTGVHEIVIGAKFDAIRKFLDPKPVWSRFVKWQIDMEGDKNPTEEMYGKKDVWLVKTTETKFFTYMDVKVKRIEVLLDESMQVKEVTLMIENVGVNWGLIESGSIAKFGNTVGSQAVGGNQKYLPWEKSSYRYSIANWDAYSPEASEEEADKWVYVNFSMIGE